MNEILDLNDTIKAHVSQLSYGWFLGKEKEFKSIREFYGSEETIVCENHDVFIEDEWFNEVDELGISPGDSFVEDVIIDLRKFCDCYLPLDTRTGCGKYPIEDWLECSELSNIDEFASDLVDEIDVFAKDIVVDNSTLGKFIYKLQEIIDKELYLLKIGNPKNEVYSCVLDDFLNKCMVKLHAKYLRELTVYNFTTEPNNKHDFSLTQDQLLALLFILNKAEFFNNSDHNRFLRFCMEHFRYDGGDGNMVAPPKLLSLQKKYNNIEASQNSKSKQKDIRTGLILIEKKLTSVFDKLR